MADETPSPDPMLDSLLRDAEASMERIERERARPAEAGGVEVPVEGVASAFSAEKPEGAMQVPGEAAGLRAEVERVRATLEKVEGVRKETNQKWLQAMAELQKAEAEKKDLSDKNLRALAELDNFRKRVARERAEAQKYAPEGLGREMLGVIDNLDRALDAAPLAAGDPGLAQLVEGVRMTRALFLQALARFEIRPFESVGRPFDPARHQAVSHLVTAAAPPGTVMSEMQRGYFLHDRLLRPAAVVVAREPDEAPAHGLPGEDPGNPPESPEGPAGGA